MEQITNKDIIEKLKQIERTMATKKELEEAIETISILSNEDTMRQIRDSERNIKEGKTKIINSVSDL